MSEPKDYLDNIEAAELQGVDTDNSPITNLEFEKWKLDPEAKKEFPDINKDSLTGNLNNSEMNTIYLGENCHIGIKALHDMISENKSIQNYFLAPELMNFMIRKKSSILALSNSKDGFRIKLIHIKHLFKETTENKPSTGQQPRPGFRGLFYKKKENPP